MQTEPDQGSGEPGRKSATLPLSMRSISKPICQQSSKRMATTDIRWRSSGLSKLWVLVFISA
jgi:hypothetical protein